ncbi:MAG: hypothetical protein HPZ91_16265 [Lentisphaeria bacterium]|nr:hypothetical protein [Lentisphaeria bacterium]
MKQSMFVTAALCLCAAFAPAAEYAGKANAEKWGFQTENTGTKRDGILTLSTRNAGLSPYASTGGIRLENGCTYILTAQVKATPGTPFRVYVENPKKWENKLVGPVAGDGEWGEIRGSFTFHDAEEAPSHAVFQLLGAGTAELRSLTIEPAPPEKPGEPREFLGKTTAPDWGLQPAGSGRIRDGKLTMTAPGTAVLGGLKTKDMQPYECIVRVKSTPGTHCRIYIENASNGIWQNIMIADADGDGTTHTFRAYYTFKKPDTPSYFACQFSGRGELTLESVRLTELEPVPPGKLRNGDFSRGTASWELDEAGEIKAGELHVAVPENGTVRRVRQYAIPVESSKRYRISYDVRGTGKGDSNAFHWFRVYPEGVPAGESERQFQSCMNYPQRKSIEFVAPPRSTIVTLAVETRGPAAVAFDNFSMEEVVEQKEPGEIKLDLPFAFRDGIFSSTPERNISGTIEINAPETVKWTLEAAGEAVPLDGERFEFTPPAGKTEFELVLTLFGKAGKPFARSAKTLRVYPHRPNEVAFTREGYLVVGGKRFFPIGHTETTGRGGFDFEFREFAAAGFNTVSLQATPDVLDAAQKHGIRILRSLPLGIAGDSPEKRAAMRELLRRDIEQQSSHPALLGYFSADEPAWIGVPFDGLKEVYDLVRAADPWHPAWINEAPIATNLRDLRRYSQAADIGGIDIYPVPEGGAHGSLEEDRGLTAVGKFTDIYREVVGGRKPVWMVLQAFAWGQCHNPGLPPEQAVYPTWEQSRFMAYNAITHGATGIIYHYLPYAKVLGEQFWKELRRVTRELNYASDIITADTVADTALAADSSSIRFMHKKLNGAEYVIAVNEGTEPVTAVFTGFPEKEALLHVLLEDGRKIPVKNGAFRLDLPARGVALLSTRKFAPRETVFGEEGMRLYNAPAEEDPESALLKRGSWIWRKCEAPAGSRSFFRRTFDGREVAKAELHVTADDFYRFRLNGKAAGGDVPGQYLRGGWSSIERYDLTPLLNAGENLLEFEAWDGGAVPCGFYAVLKLTMRGGSERIDGSSAAWESAAAPQGPFAPSVEIAPFGDAPWGRRVIVQEGTDSPAPRQK